ncbi:hypothetical protein GCM10008934_10280 [Virgibacillus salarius]|uniref:SH3 domain-containing protein n=1 Tax=Virgibacillus salarius TaxID=447199 RepID=UPI0031D10FA7
MIRKILSVLLLLTLVSTYLQPISAIEKVDSYKLVKTETDIKLNDNLIIHKGTFIYTKKKNKENDVVNFNGKEFDVSKKDLHYITEDEKSELTNVPLFIDSKNGEEAEYKSVEKLFGYNDGMITTDSKNDNKLPVYSSNGYEVVYVGNSEFYINRDDYEAIAKKMQDPDQGAEQDPDQGAEQDPDQGAEQDPDQGAEQDPDQGAEQDPDQGTEQDPDQGTEQDPDQGTEQDPDQGADHKNNLLNSKTNMSEFQTLPVKTWTKQDKYFKVTNDNAVVYDIRSGKYIKVGQLVKGQEYKRVGESGNYHKIRYGDYYGYIHKGHTVWSDGSSIKNENTRYDNSDRSFTANGNITVYDNSSGSFKSFGTISSGTEFAIATDAGNFWRIIYADRIGYVYKSGTKVPFEKQDKYFKVTSDNAVVYDIRSGNYLKVGQLVKGQEYKRVGESGNYHKIRYGNYYGYIYKSYTVWSDGSSIKNENTRYDNSDRSFTANGNITVYDNSSGSFKSFGTISSGTEFAIATDAGNFWRIIYADRIGYVYKSGTKMQFKSSDKYFELIKDAPVYDIRSGNYVKVAELVKGEVYPRIGKSGNYHMIMLGDFKGFIHTSYTVVGDGSKIKNEKDNEQNINKRIVVDKDAPVYDISSGSFVEIGSLTEGTIYRVISDGSNYVKVIFGDRIGYINKKNLSPYGIKYSNYDLSLDEAVKIQKKANPQTDKEYDTFVSKSYIKNGKVTASTLNVRGGPSTNYWIVGQLKEGAKVTVINEVNGWYQIEFTNSRQWVNASPEDVEYYLDPNNFINDERQQFQFLDLARSSDVSASVLNNYLNGKGKLSGQGQAFIDAGIVNGINDIYLVSHAVLETGHGTSTLSKGVKYNGVTVYNMFGIGAYDQCPVECGAKKAYEEGWTTPYKAIVGGASFIGNDFINNGLNTLYKMRWNPKSMEENGRYGKQYATDIGWASKQVYTMYNLYQEIGSYTLYLDIPNYK